MTAIPDQDTPGTLPEFPGVRAAACPFDPPPALQALQREAPLTRVRLRDGGTAWLVTGYAEQKAVLSHPQVSSDITRPGYPLPLQTREDPLQARRPGVRGVRTPRDLVKTSPARNLRSAVPATRGDAGQAAAPAGTRRNLLLKT
ncbi:hypothetical protein ACWDTT_35515 [Streptosporangium sandarakinum]|uniref:hypothetical protein n=1 Tax=Streptosporangium TaxID=2000 RepID=UPI0031F8C1F1